MSAEELSALVLSGLALLIVATAFGATVMWRLVHQPNQPPALPVWVSGLLVLGGALLIVAAVIAGQWLGIASAVSISITFVIQFVVSLRRRSASNQ